MTRLLIQKVSHQGEVQETVLKYSENKEKKLKEENKFPSKLLCFE